MRLRRVTVTAVVATVALVATAAPAHASTWASARTLQGTFAVSSPPDPAAIAVNGAGHTVAAWSATGNVRFAEKTKAGLWTPSARVTPGATGGPVAVAIGADETTAVAWVTVGTRLVPAALVVTVRMPGATFPIPVQVAPGAGVWNLSLGVAADGAATLLWSGPNGVQTSSLAPGGTWVTPVTLTASGALPALAVNDSGAAVASWMQGAAGAPTEVAAATRPAGGAWGAAQVISAGSGNQTWNPKPGIDAAGDGAVAFLDGTVLTLATYPAGGTWTAPTAISPSAHAAYYPALAMDGGGDLLLAWQALDAGGYGTTFARWLPAGGALGATTRLSGAAQSAGWPTASLSGDGSVGAVTWVDDIGQRSRAATGPVGSAWVKASIGSGWWGGTVPVAAGGGIVAATWAAVAIPGNPNSAKLMARIYA
jgi:hypothetical protein